MKNCRGMTILDLVATMAIAAILVTAAAPSFDRYMRNNAVYADRKNLNTAVMSARYEAVARNKTVTMCPSLAGEDCGGDWSDGWIIFQDDGAGGGTARDGIRNGGEPVIHAFLYHGTNLFTVFNPSDNSAVDFLSFNEYGRPAVDGTVTSRPVVIQVCDSNHDSHYARGLMLISTGRLLQTVDSDGDGVHESRFADGSNTISINTPLSCENEIS